MGRRWPAEPQRYRWIVDGHNAIFAHPELERLQTGGKRGEARRKLEVMLDRLSAENGIEMLIVYDGNRIDRNPGTSRTGRIRTQYSASPEEEADDRIIFLVQDAIRSGLKPAVVTSDRATLGARLPTGVLRLDPSEAFRRLRSRRDRRKGEERPPGDFSDIEAHFLSLDGAPPDSAGGVKDDPRRMEEAPPPDRRSAGRRSSGGKKPASG